MRLLKLNDGKLSLTGDLQDSIPPYAILSHTWGDDEDEVHFDDLIHSSYEEKAGFTKIQFCGEQAKRDKLEFFWVDTCCINKANHTELSEAITSMFRWYRNAAKCYVYLSDVSIRDEDDDHTKWTSKTAFQNSRWFTRGWTLQELIAPASVEFVVPGICRARSTSRFAACPIAGVATALLQISSSVWMRERWLETSARTTPRGAMSPG